MVTPQEMRVRLGLDAADEEEDALIAALLAEAEAFARTYCHLSAGETVPDGLLIRMAQEDYGRLEGAGLSSRTASGVSEYYRTAYSGDILAALRALRHPDGREAVR